MWREAMREVRKKKSWWYRPPLPLKKQRVTARAERPGKCHIYTEEEKLIYRLKMFGEGVSTE